MADRRSLFIKVSVEDLEKIKADLRSVGDAGAKSFQTMDRAGAQASKGLVDSSAKANVSIGTLAQGAKGLAQQLATGNVSMEALTATATGFAGALGGPLGSIALVAALTGGIYLATRAFEAFGKEVDHLAEAQARAKEAMDLAKKAAGDLKVSTEQAAEASRAMARSKLAEAESHLKAAEAKVVEAEANTQIDSMAIGPGAPSVDDDPRVKRARAVVTAIRDEINAVRSALANYQDIFNRGGTLRTPFGPGGPGTTEEERKKAAAAANAAHKSVLEEQFKREVQFNMDTIREAEKTADKLFEMAKKAQEDAAKEAIKPWERFGDDLERLLGQVFEDIFDDGKIEFEKLAKAALSSFAKFGFDLAKTQIFKPMFDDLGAQLGSLLGSGGTGTIKAGIGGGALGLGIGSLAGLIPGLNAENAQLGGAIGGGIGAAVGSFIPVIGTALGGLIGSILGSGAGGLFGPKKPSVGPGANVLFGTTTATGAGRPRIVGSGADNGGDLGAAQQFGAALETAINRTIDQLGLAGGRFGGLVAGINSGGFGIGLGGSGSAPFNIASGQNAEAVISQFLFHALKQGDWAANTSKGYFTGFSDEMGAALAGSKATNLEGLLADLEKPALRKAFDETVELAILAFTNPVEAALAEFDKAAEERLKQARELGADLVDVERLIALERQRVAEQSGSSLSRFRDELSFGAISGASPLASLEGTRASFLAAAAQRDTGRVEELGRSLLTLSRGAFASGGGFQSDLNLVRDVVGDLASPQSAVVAAINASAGEQIRLQAQMVARLGQIANENAEMREEIARLSAALQRLLAA